MKGRLILMPNTLDFGVPGAEMPLQDGALLGKVALVIDCSGHEGAVLAGCGMLRRGGTATIVGMIPIGQMVSIMGAAFLGEKKLQGSMMGSNRFPVDMPRLVDFYMNGKLKLDQMISQRIKLEQVNEGFADMKRGELARSVIMFNI